MISFNPSSPIRFASLVERKQAVEKRDRVAEIQDYLTSQQIPQRLAKEVLPAVGGEPAITGKALLKMILELPNPQNTDPDSQAYGHFASDFDRILKANFAESEIKPIKNAIRDMHDWNLLKEVNGSITAYPEQEYAGHFVVGYQLTDIGELALQDPKKLA